MTRNIYKLSYEGEKLIQHYESCRLTAYQDSVGIWTIGFGNTFYEDGRPVTEGDIIPQWRADELFKRVVSKFERAVNDLGLNLKQNQFDALVSFAWNEGIEALQQSILIRKIRNTPDDLIGIDDEFLKWIYAGGKKLRGLVARRRSESLLYRTGDLKFFN